MPATATYNLTGNAYIDGVLGGVKWAVNSLTFSFPMSGSFYEAGYGDGEPTNNFGALNATQQAAARSALGMYGAVANLTFTETTETSSRHGDLRFAMSDAPSTAWAYFPSPAPEGGDVWFNKSNGYYSSPQRGNYAYATFMHEIGHALGLDHPQEGTVMPADRDSLEYTVMSYRSYVAASLTSGYVNETWGYPQSPMMYDIAAVQHMYGANFTTYGSSTTYSWSPTTGEMFINGVGQGAPGANRIFLTVWDGGGADTYDFSNYGTSLTINLQPGAWSTTSSAQLARLHYDGSRLAAGNIANALLYNGDLRSLIENAVGGTGNDIITGNQAANSLWGGTGDDRLTGLGGDDVLNGGAGNDTAVFSGTRSQYDAVRLSDGSIRFADARPSGDGADTVRNIEWLQFSDRTYALSEITFNFIKVSDLFPRYVIENTGDFNGDVRDDILFRDSSTGTVYLWEMNGAQIASRNTVSDLYPQYHIEGTGDFNGDGKDDILFRDSITGTVYLWEMNGAQIARRSTVSDLYPQYHIEGTGDFNGDVKDDILLRDSITGTVYLWEMNGAQIASRSTVSDLYLQYDIAGIGESNGDGKDDILLRDTSAGSLHEWLMNGAQVAARNTVGALDPQSSVQPLADLNADGLDDILVRDSAGAVYASLTSGHWMI